MNIPEKDLGKDAPPDDLEKRKLHEEEIIANSEVKESDVCLKPAAND